MSLDRYVFECTDKFGAMELPKALKFIKLADPILMKENRIPLPPC